MVAGCAGVVTPDHTVHIEGDLYGTATSVIRHLHRGRAGGVREGPLPLEAALVGHSAGQVSGLW